MFGHAYFPAYVLDERLANTLKSSTFEIERERELSFLEKAELFVRSPTDVSSPWQQLLKV